MKRTKMKDTLLIQAIATGGLRNAIRAMSMLACYAIQWQDEEAPPRTWDLYMAYWKTTRTIWYEDLKAYRACFPGIDHPRDLIQLLIDRGDLPELGTPEDLELGIGAISSMQALAA